MREARTVLRDACGMRVYFNVYGRVCMCVFYVYRKMKRKKESENE